jgi:hypothetical protein
MSKMFAMSALAVLLSGCYYGYTTVRTVKADGGRECSIEIAKKGNSVFGYDESDFSNLERGEKDCREWLKK